VTPSRKLSRLSGWGVPCPTSSGFPRGAAEDGSRAKIAPGQGRRTARHLATQSLRAAQWQPRRILDGQTVPLPHPPRLGRPNPALENQKNFGRPHSGDFAVPSPRESLKEIAEPPTRFTCRDGPTVETPAAVTCPTRPLDARLPAGEAESRFAITCGRPSLGGGARSRGRNMRWLWVPYHLTCGCACGM